MAISKVDQKNFAKEIYRLQKIHDCTILEAISKHAETKGVFAESLVKHISKSLRNRIAVEARSLNLLKRRSRK